MRQAADELYALPPSAKLVYRVLEENDRMTQRELADETMLSPRTVRSALARLEDVDAVDEGVYFRDARKSIYSLADDHPIARAEGSAD